MMNGSDQGNKGVALSIGAASSTALVTASTPKGKGRKRRTTSRLTIRKNKKVATPNKATPMNLYEPQMFIRRIVYKRNENGGIILGSVQYYNANIEKFCVLYEDGEEIHEEFSELRNKLATGKVIAEALPPQSISSNVPKTTVTEEKKRPASGEGSSAPPKKKGKASGKNATKSKE